MSIMKQLKAAHRGAGGSRIVVTSIVAGLSLFGVMWLWDRRPSSPLNRYTATLKGTDETKAREVYQLAKTGNQFAAAFWESLRGVNPELVSKVEGPDAGVAQ